MKSQANTIGYSFFAASIACLAALLGGLYYMAKLQDDQARKSQVLMVQGGVEQMQGTLKSLTQDYAWWDDFYQNVNPPVDEWLATNIQTAVTFNGTMDFLIVYDAGHKPIRAWSTAGGEVSDSSFITPEFQAAFDSLVADNPAGSFKARGGVANLLGGTVMFTTSHIYPTNEALLLDREKQPYLVIGYKFSPERIAAIGENFLIENLQFIAAANDTSGLLPIVGGAGGTLGYLDWKVSTPGTGVLRGAIVPIFTIAGAILALGGFFAFRARRGAKAMEGSEREARSQAEASAKELEAKSRMAQLGKLTATVAHELRNPLAAVRTSVFLLEKKVKKQDWNLDQQLSRINNGIVRCDNIITQLLDFARTAPVKTTQGDLDQWLAKLLNEETQQMPPQVEIECDLGVGGHPVNFDGERLSRAIVNLVNNASEALVGKDGAHVNCTGGKPKINVETRRTGRGIEISVKDNGPGMTDDVLTRVREPLFTTKNFGTGLGIPAIEKIMEQHGGGLDISTEPGKGSTFTVWWPEVEMMEEAA